MHEVKVMNWLKSFWKKLNTPQSRPSVFVPHWSPVNPHREESPSNFTPHAQQVLALSRREADRFNHNFVGTEHLLLGLIKLGQGVAVTVLHKMGLDLDGVRAEVEKQVGAGPDQEKIGNIPYTPRVKKVLALAAKEAKVLNHTYVGTEHILLGLLREGDGVAARVLNNLGVNREKTRDAILSELDPNYKCTTPETAPATSSKPMTTKSTREPVDITLRYDVYCKEHNERIVVYRNALFKNIRGLFQKGDFDVLGEYMELEQRDGQTIFISRSSVVRFCQHGVKPEPEDLSGAKE